MKNICKRLLLVLHKFGKDSVKTICDLLADFDKDELNQFFSQVSQGLKILVTKYKMQRNNYKTRSTSNISWMQTCQPFEFSDLEILAKYF